MLRDIFIAVLVTSLAGTLLAGFVTIIKPFTRKIFSSSWHYYIWLIVLLVMVLPIKISLPQKSIAVPKNEMVFEDVQKAGSSEETIVTDGGELHLISGTNESGKSENLKMYAYDKLNIISLIWFFGMIAFLFCTLTAYVIFLIRLHKYSRVVSLCEIKCFTDKKITIRKTDKISSPLMTGIFKPILLLPETSLSPNQLNNVLAHEMTHFKRKDILYKWFTVIVKCIHWFNPAVYCISRHIDMECEVSCDLAVLKEMDDEQEHCYIDTILALISAGNLKRNALTTGMASSKKTIKKRFTLIKNGKNLKNPARIISAVFAVVLFVTTLLASGIMASETPDEKSNIHFICNGEFIEFKNNPFWENSTVYLPLTELLHKVGIMEHKNSSVKRKDEKIIIRLASDVNVPAYDESGKETGTKQKQANYCFLIEVGKPMYIINPKGEVSFSNPLYNKNINRTVELKNSPVIRDKVIYVPYEYIEHFLGFCMSGLGSDSIDGPHDITCIVDGENPVAYVTPGFMWPADTKIGASVTNGFGVRTHPVTGEKKIHNGIDIKAEENSPVISAIRGQVTEVDYNSELGNYIVVSNDGGVSTLYAHLSSVEVKKGDSVKRGATLGKAGKTGTVTGGALHFEIMINGTYYDPMEFWEATVIEEVVEIKNKDLLKPENVPEVSNINTADLPAEIISMEEEEAPVQADNTPKIKSSLVGDEPYMGFEHLILENANVDVIEQELNNLGITETESSFADLKKNYIIKDYGSEGTTVKSDENGNISLYFSINSDNLFDVNFYDAETNEDVGGFGVLANNENAYSFIGFQKDRSYRVEVRGQAENDWDIEGNYIIY